MSKIKSTLVRFTEEQKVELLIVIINQLTDEKLEECIDLFKLILEARKL
ncbi:MAG TPA: hypothetical protein VMY06_13440 [Sedimentisphaerales bacterium]|nr:hypothetical protein [Sedimentisphaerales bacterium]